MKLKLIAITFCFSSLFGENIFVAQEAIQFRGSDGFALNGFLWKQPAQSLGILLLHQCDMDQSMYDNLARELFKNGFHVMTFDYRGIGRSASPDYDFSSETRNKTWNRIEEQSDTDMNAALKFFKSSADISALSILAASCGGNKAIKLALQNKNELRALGFLSTRLSAQSISSLNELRTIPMIFISSKGDKGAFDASMKGVEINQSPNTTSYFYGGKDHGFPLFKKDSQLEGKIVEWFKKMIL